MKKRRVQSAARSNPLQCYYMEIIVEMMTNFQIRYILRLKVGVKLPHPLIYLFYAPLDIIFSALVSEENTL